MSTILSHLRYGVRMLVRRPGLSISAVTALALGIGLTTTMFSIVYVAVIKGLPYEEADRLVALFRNRPAQGVQFMEGSTAGRRGPFERRPRAAGLADRAALLLPSAVCLLPFAFCLLPSAFCRVHPVILALQGGPAVADSRLIGQNYTTADLVAKVTGRARYAEDYRAEGMAASIRSWGIAKTRKSLAPVVVSAASSALVIAASVAQAVAWNSGVIRSFGSI